MTVIHGTKKFRDRTPSPPKDREIAETRVLDRWYATVLFWRPQVALLVNTSTLLPLLMPLAPASSLFTRFPEELRLLLETHQAPADFIHAEIEAAKSCTLLPTRDRSVLGVMNEFAFLAEARREQTSDLVALAIALSRTPCSPLYNRHVSPDRELAALHEG